VDKIFWIDLEMSGLDVNKEVIIEVGAVITDLDFNELENYHAVVRQPQHYIDNMDDWNKKHHGESGLIALIPTGKEPAVVEEELCQLVRKHFPDEAPVIAGNTIHQDRTFIDRYFLKFSGLLHYRMLDVSSWKIIFNNKFNITHEKQNRHRAVEDIYESIGELKAYLQYVKIEK
jgi:oligoribonuclease